MKKIFMGIEIAKILLYQAELSLNINEGAIISKVTKKNACIRKKAKSIKMLVNLRNFLIFIRSLNHLEK